MICPQGPAGTQKFQIARVATLPPRQCTDEARAAVQTSFLQRLNLIGCARD